MASHGEKILVMELTAAQVIITVRELANGRSPKPHQYIASLIVFAVLGGVAVFSDDAAKFAGALGGLVLLSTIVEGAGGWSNPLTPQNILSTFGKVPGALQGTNPQPASVSPIRARTVSTPTPGGTHQPTGLI